MDNSSFNSLPAELRITIYEYALTFDRIRAECQHLPFTLNKLVVGEASWHLKQLSWSISHLCTLADEVAQNVASIPPALISEPTVLSLDLIPSARSMLMYAHRPYEQNLLVRWVDVKMFFGRLLRTTRARKFILDITPNEIFGVHLWCDAGQGLPIKTDRESRYELQPEVATGGEDAGHFIVAATFNTAQVLATADRHRDHDRSLCNVAKHGDAILARMAELERVAGTVIDRNIDTWNSSISLLHTWQYTVDCDATVDP